MAEYGPALMLVVLGICYIATPSLYATTLSTEGINESVYLKPTGTGRVITGGDSLNLASKSEDPLTGHMGQLYFDSGLEEFRGFQGTSWRSLSTTNTESIDLEKNSSQYLSITDAAQTGLDITGSISISLWVKLESLIPTNNAWGLVCKSNTLTGNRAYCLAYEDDSGTSQYLDFRYSGDGTSANDTIGRYTVTLLPNHWYHIAVTADVAHQVVKYYVDGVEHSATNPQSLSSAIYNSTAPLRIGAGNQADNPFDGLIDDVRIWNRVRTPAELAADFNRELGGGERELMGYWKLDGTLKDETDNHNGLTNNNAAVYSSDRGF